MEPTQPISPPAPVETKSEKNFWPEFLKLIVISVIIVIPFRLFIAQPFIVDGASMDPTFHNGQYLIVDELTYRFQEPERGSVLIFKYPKDPSKFFIKRVIGLPGETVRITEGAVSIVNEEYPEGLLLHEPYIEFTKVDNLEVILGSEEYFVMGDNRKGSADSRLWGPVPADNIVGRPIIRFYPLGLFPGQAVSIIDTE